MVNKAHIGIGSNLGDKAKNIALALEDIEDFSLIIKKSSLYTTEPVGYTNQEDFLNMVIFIETDLSPIELLARLQETEHKLGRIRGIKNGPRVIDLDILTFNTDKISNDHLKIPHPHMHLRNFVLTPLVEISANVIHPTINKSFREIRDGLDYQERVTLFINE